MCVRRFERIKTTTRCDTFQEKAHALARAHSKCIGLCVNRAVVVVLSVLCTRMLASGMDILTCTTWDSTRHRTMHAYIHRCIHS
jgi:hypothetical protein